MTTCEHCGGSGVLNIAVSSMGLGYWDDRPYVSTCHGCQMGGVWFEVGIDT